MRPNSDLEIAKNNCVVAVRPSRNGRLKNMVQERKDGLERVWVFCDQEPWKDKDGDERIDHQRRGLMCGDLKQFELFTRIIIALGLLPRSTGFYVPCSNEREFIGQTLDGKPLADFPESDQKMVRIDLPTAEDLLEAMQD